MRRSRALNRFLRDNGFGVALVIGVALLAVGLTAANPAALVIAIILLVIGVSARPLEQFALGRSGFLLKWQREVARELERRLEERLTISDSVEAKVIRGSGNVVVEPPTIHVEARTFEPTVIVRPQSPDEFAETLVEQIIKPAFIASEEHVSAPTLEQMQPEPDA